MLPVYSVDRKNGETLDTRKVLEDHVIGIEPLNGVPQNTAWV